MHYLAKVTVRGKDYFGTGDNDSDAIRDALPLITGHYSIHDRISVYHIYEDGTELSYTTTIGQYLIDTE